MKRFVFSLQVLLKVKQTLEKQQKIMLAEIQKKLSGLIAEMERLRGEQEALSERYGHEASGGMSPDRLAVYGRYFDLLRDSIKEQAERIEEARREKAHMQAKLLRTMNEIKTLKKLREAQYKEYLAQVAREEAEAINELVAFKLVAGEA